MKKLTLILLSLALLAMPAAAQFAAVQKGPVTANIQGPSLAVDTTTGQIYFCNGPCTGGDVLLGEFQGTTATSITTTSFTSLTGPNIKIPTGEANVLNKHVRITAKGVYTTAAAALLGARILVCQTSNACGGTTVAPAGCSVVSTNQANNLTNGQWSLGCDFTTAVIGSSGTFMAKAQASFNLGAATSAVQSVFQDTATAASAAIDLTQDEYLVPQFQFATSNAGDLATVEQMTVELLN